MIERKRQVSVINTFYKETLLQDEPQIGKCSNSDISTAMLKEQFVFVLYVNILPNVEDSSFASYDELSKGKSWYNNRDIVGEIR